jgi:hypothetical protein
MSTRKLGVYASKEEFLENEVRTLSHHIASMIDTMKVMSMNRQHMLEEIERLKLEAEAAVLAEREACAKVCDGWDFIPGGHESFPQQLTKNLTETIANHIRARGQE